MYFQFVSHKRHMLPDSKSFTEPFHHKSRLRLRHLLSGHHSHHKSKSSRRSNASHHSSRQSSKHSKEHIIQKSGVHASKGKINVSFNDEITMQVMSKSPISLILVEVKLQIPLPLFYHIVDLWILSTTNSICCWIQRSHIYVWFQVIMVLLLWC